MTDADKLERIRSIVRDHDAYGLTRHHEMVLDITDVLANESTPPEDGWGSLERALQHNRVRVARAIGLLESMGASQLAHGSRQWLEQRLALLASKEVE